MGRTSGPKEDTKKKASVAGEHPMTEDFPVSAKAGTKEAATSQIAADVDQEEPHQDAHRPRHIPGGTWLWQVGSRLQAWGECVGPGHKKSGCLAISLLTFGYLFHNTSQP
ncbi:hypothetical protein NDU88_007061 [Pleurodeles waltl]|uniref:Uncharacterized protein n=1 Tax=Pleurodeles waltl TaxID=8319 RepID=A0AAV7N121_PLEWA|nr:hypothetical protein NDU88_007061 [Pleurodeles waltl]